MAQSREIAAVDLVDEEIVEPLTVLHRALNTESQPEADAFCQWYDRRSPETKLGHHFQALEPEEEGPLSEGCLVAPSFIGYAEMPSYAQWLAGQPRSVFFTFLRDVLKYLQWQGLAAP